MIKERPILMNGAMVRATLEGRKTQTRRIVKPHDGAVSLERAIAKYCPHGKPCDRLWVRETHLPKASGTIYRADYSEFEAAGLGGLYGGWKPSIFCKREHSRILLEITNVRIERLQDINEEDAQAEGARRFDNLPSTHPFGQDPRWSMVDPTSTAQCLGSARFAFANLWETINGPGSWDSNPWVWVIEFKVVQP